MASSFNWHGQLFLAQLFVDEGSFDDAQAHIECAKPHAVNHTYFLGHTMRLQAELWYKQYRLEEASSMALRAAEVYEKLGAVPDLKICRGLLRQIEEEMDKSVIPEELAGDGKSLVWDNVNCCVH